MLLLSDFDDDDDDDVVVVDDHEGSSGAHASEDGGNGSGTKRSRTVSEGNTGGRDGMRTAMLKLRQQTSGGGTCPNQTATRRT